ncbi:caspase family protein [Pedobacter sp. MR2016-19]|uniref:caspase family protein n=1 Tax=Pedobacter sp. MR2016-19 TaxID=2780089 RepID=UPI0018753DE1|nr:caspase family protein [Pedobacter sp. MR2016-19]MBE5320120.1 caspase family protein [Pedobacter sp. MR2016-19]
MKGALLVGIDDYHGGNQLKGCVNDATALADLLAKNEDGTSNFQIELQNNIKTKGELKKAVTRLFHSDLNVALFYFAGHGCTTDIGGYIVTPDYGSYDEGISMDELLSLCNYSPIKEKIIVLDCCYSGHIGSPHLLGGKATYLGNGVTVLTASGMSETSVESGGHGLFTLLLLKALEGGAADIVGNITIGSIYAYIDRSLGFWQQRPQFKTNVSRFMPLRTTYPSIQPLTVLNTITEFFAEPESVFQLDPSYEYSNTGVAIEANVQIFKKLQKMQGVGLVIPHDEEHLYWAAQNSKGCKLTVLGKHYWKLVKENRI